MHYRMNGFAFLMRYLDISRKFGFFDGEVVHMNYSMVLIVGSHLCVKDYRLWSAIWAENRNQKYGTQTFVLIQFLFTMNCAMHSQKCLAICEFHLRSFNNTPF